jgi:HTH-type transcriptional regulator, sugar sensing transcriptional regulator
MADIQSILRKLDLTENEIKVYLALLQRGKSKAGALAKESMIERSSCYNALKRLVEKGMVSYAIEARRKVYAAAHPKKIIDYYKEKEEIAANAIPELENLYKQTKDIEDIKLFKGYKGIKTIFLEILRERKENLVFGTEGLFSQKMPYFAPHYIKEIEKRKIKIRNLRSEKSTGLVTKTTQVKYIPKRFTSNVETNIFSNKIAIITWSEPPEAVLIENRVAADSYRNYFEFMWKHARK